MSITQELISIAKLKQLTKHNSDARDHNKQAKNVSVCFYSHNEMYENVDKTKKTDIMHLTNVCIIWP